MSAIPIDGPELVTILNLPADLSRNPIWGEHAGLVLAELAELLDEDTYADAVGDMAAEDEGYQAIRVAYAFMMLRSALEFLNLKTVGEGIVKVVGMDAATTELLTGGEIDAFKDRLELRVLKQLRTWLSAAGLERLDELKPRQARIIRIGVI
ncbi:MAG: hypothetical protein LHW45_08120 [Candidatus Cloacimonetes bacterium]|nr:hypothetical protein [Candidatus Cloacimonadota bacterium]MDY0367575.1 hypothetical protein [Candidatus Syntrophosphaera sp.]